MRILRLAWPPGSRRSSTSMGGAKTRSPLLPCLTRHGAASPGWTVLTAAPVVGFDARPVGLVFVAVSLPPYVSPSVLHTAIASTCPLRILTSSRQLYAHPTHADLGCSDMTGMWHRAEECWGEYL